MNHKTKFKAFFIPGLVLAILAAVLMVLNILPNSARITIGIVGIILIAIAPHQAKKNIEKKN